MKYLITSFALALLLFPRSGTAADTPAAAAAPSGFKADWLMLLDRTEKEITSLEEAMPDKKFGWRPTKGVRSVAEVYLHAAGAVYFFAGKMGKEAPADVKAVMEAKKWESQTTTKAGVKDVLMKSFAFARELINSTSDADLDKKVDFFGNQVTLRALFMAMGGHFQEHLGQSIAYARMNGVVPPWSKGDH
jgi:uncharacterized damage-inducible protein DinB